MEALPEYSEYAYEGDCCFLDGTYTTKEYVGNWYFIQWNEEMAKDMGDVGKSVSWCCICGGLGVESGRCWGCQ
jgi:hypothetical protein